jgi:FixJ family two-component response regulator
MNVKTVKTVLIVDDEQRMCEELKDRFYDCNKKAECPYEFEVDVALSATECIEKIRAKSAGDDKPPYDVIVLDIRMEEETSGLETAFVFQLYQQLGWAEPIRIIFTGWPDYQQCVAAMRYGAWDYIRKEDVGDIPAAQIVVDSAVARLRQLDLLREQKRLIAGSWLPQHFHDLQAKYGGQLIALWHLPAIEVITSGRDAFELEDKLKGWRGQHPAWEQPYIVRIQLPRVKDGVEG